MQLVLLLINVSVVCRIKIDYLLTKIQHVNARMVIIQIPSRLSAELATTNVQLAKNPIFA